MFPQPQFWLSRLHSALCFHNLAYIAQQQVPVSVTAFLVTQNGDTIHIQFYWYQNFCQSSTKWQKLLENFHRYFQMLQIGIYGPETGTFQASYQKSINRTYSWHLLEGTEECHKAVTRYSLLFQTVWQFMNKNYVCTKLPALMRYSCHTQSHTYYDLPLSSHASTELVVSMLWCH